MMVACRLATTVMFVKNKVRETFRGIPEEQIKEFVIYGTPEDVSIQI
jgi:hypothetical protein